MTSENSARLLQRFVRYVDSYRKNSVLHPMHQLKLEHTLRVAGDARFIAEQSEFSTAEIDLAEAIGLMHDVGRFSQFKKYGSFDDSKTIDHGDLGAETILTENMLAGINEPERDLILFGVKHHNKKALPPEMNAAAEKLLRLIRDADRLDIFFIGWDVIKTGRIHDHPEIIMGIDFDGAPSDAVLDQFEHSQPIDYRTLNSLADRFVLQLSWMIDLSFPATKKLIIERDILDKFIDILPVKTDRLLNCFRTTKKLLQDDSLTA
ncbi:MAG: HD domain-containing protein [Kiritimatiellales bacterium]